MAARSRCKDCVAEGVTTRRPAPHPGPRCATHHRAKRSAVRERARASRLEAVYGITEDEYQRIYAAQGGCCYICRRAKGTGRKRLSVDHDHTTGYVRGLLCKPCNLNVIGHLRDDPAALRRGADYLTNPPAFAVIGRRAVPNQKGVSDGT